MNTQTSSKRTSRAAKIPVWISYDLGKDGDFNNLYGWLKGYEAVECGNSTAMIYYTKGRGKTLVPSLRKEIEEAIELNANSRIYIIYRGPRNTLKERWLFGNSNPSPVWSNYKPVIV